MNKRPRMGSDLGRDITPFVVISSPNTYKHDIYIHNGLEQPDELISILDVLYSASEHDQVVIHLNSGGGSIYSLDTLLSAIEMCPAHIHVIATGNIASAATFILLSADSFEISPYASLLFHSCTFGVYGESQDNLEYVQFVHKENERLMRDYYENLFSEDEINDIIVNKRQRWLTSKEFSERFEKASDKMKQQHEAQRKQDEQHLSEMFSELDELAKLPDWVIDKVTKKQLLQYINDEIDFDIDEDSKKITIVPIDTEEDK
jgi:ATP-dependent protease ClpP protease subunit